MNDITMKIPTASKLLKLPEDSKVGEEVEIPICNILGLHLTGFWTVLNTANGKFEIRCEKESLFRWKFLAQMDLQFTGEGKVINIKNEIEFSPNVNTIMIKSIDRRYNQVKLKITRKSSFGIAIEDFIDFEKKSKWLDVLIRSEDGKKMIYANSGILALNSPILKQKLENNKLAEIIMPFESFVSMKKLMNFLHPPFKMERENVEQVLDLASKWEMKSVITKYEQFLIKTRCHCQRSSIQDVKLAEKFKMASLLEEIINDGETDVFALLDGNDYSSWTRAAMFEFIVNDEDENTIHEN